MKLGWRKILAATLILLALISLPSFLEHFQFFISGQFEAIMKKNRWDLVLLNIVGFLLFLIPLNYRRKTDWKSYGIYTAFIVSLFVEMYGIPLTVFLGSSFIGPASYEASYVLTLNSIGINFGLTLWMLIGLIITLIGMAIVTAGWTTIYRTEEELTTSGIYGHSRHPQYVGIVLISLGWFIGWPTPLTTLLLPILVYTYYKLSLEEEKEMMDAVGEQRYREYMEKVPRFL